MPGVLVDTSDRPSPPSAFAPESGQYFVVGLAERGSTTGVETLSSPADFDLKCGGDTTYGFVRKDLRRFFRLGSQARFARVVGPAATKASLTLKDRSSGAGVSTLRVDAANEGAWGSQHLTVSVVDGTVAGSFRMLVKYDGSLVEDEDNLVAPVDAISAFAGSLYVTVASLSSVTAAPNNQPRLIADVPLVGGSDDRASVTTQMLIDAMNSRFPKDMGVGAVAIPGYPANLVGAALKDHANQFRRVAGAAPAKGTTQQQLKDLAASLTGADGSGTILVGPWVEADGLGTGLVSAEGIWAGLRAAAHRKVGPWAVPAGGAGEVSFITALEYEVTRAEGDALDAARVSMFRKIRQNGTDTFRLYGYRSLSTNPDFAMLKTRDLANYIESVVENDLEPYVQHQVDSRGVLAGLVSAAVEARLDPIYVAGGLTDKLDPVTGEYVPGTAYRVDVGPAVNTVQVLSRQEYDVFVGFRDSPTANEIVAHVVKAGLSADL